MKITIDNYTENVYRTLAPTDIASGVVASNDHLLNTKILRLLHAAMGIAGEAGEIIDPIKKSIFYGKKLDEVNLMEECGDLLYFVAVLLDELGYTFEEVMQINIDKLAARYPEKFTSAKAINRDLDKERKILEGKTTQPVECKGDSSDMLEEYKDICIAGFKGTFEDYIEYKKTYGKVTI